MEPFGPIAATYSSEHALTKPNVILTSKSVVNLTGYTIKVSSDINPFRHGGPFDSVIYPYSSRHVLSRLIVTLTSNTKLLFSLVKPYNTLQTMSLIDS